MNNQLRLPQFLFKYDSSDGEPTIYHHDLNTIRAILYIVEYLQNKTDINKPAKYRSLIRKRQILKIFSKNTKLFVKFYTNRAITIEKLEDFSDYLTITNDNNKVFKLKLDKTDEVEFGFINKDLTTIYIPCTFEKFKEYYKKHNNYVNYISYYKISNDVKDYIMNKNVSIYEAKALLYLSVITNLSFKKDRIKVVDKKELLRDTLNLIKQNDKRFFEALDKIRDKKIFKEFYSYEVTKDYINFKFVYDKN